MNNNNSNKFPQKKFLFVSWESLSGDVAWQIQKEGHQVKAYIKRKKDQDVYDGFLEKVGNWKDHIDWADVIVFDDVLGFGKIAEGLRKRGKLVVGGTAYTDKLEDEREFGQEEMKRVGMNIIPHWDFSDFDSAIKFIREHPDRYVFKPSGSAPKGLLFLGEEEDGKDILEILEVNKDIWVKRIKIFQLQKRMVGVEIAVGAFFNGTDFIYPINVNFEHKRLFPGEMGPFTGDMGALMYWTNSNAIFDATLGKMKSTLQKEGYVGYIDINCIVNGRGIYPLEYTARFGYPTISVQMEGILTPIGEFFYKLANGENIDLKTKKGFQIGVRVLLETYVSSDPADIQFYKDLSVLFRRPNPNYEGIHLADVKLVKGQLRVAGDSGCVLTVTGAGSTVEEARRQVYGRLKNIRLQNMFYRVDIGKRWDHDSDKLQTWGYL